MDALRYRDSHDVSSSDDSEDSDKECTVWKRATVKRKSENEIAVLEDEDEVVPVETEEVKETPVQGKPKRKRNTIWSEVLQDQLISEDLEDCLLKNKPRDYGIRGKESYDYTLRYADSRSEIDSDCHMSDSALAEEPSESKMKHPPSFRNNVKKFVKLDSAEITAARKINKILNEKKFYLIQRIVKIMGIEKSMDLLSMTQDIEDNGGMMINNNTRRRTPGGVYIQLLKSDKSVTQEMLDKIFEGEMSGIEVKRYYAEQKKNKKKKKYMKKKESDKMSKNDSEIQESKNMPMDAEIITDIKPENSADNSTISAPLFNKSPSKNDSDLEEGEIEE